MNPEAIKSTALSTVVYDTDREILEVKFCDHSVYRYFGVPAEVGALFVAASKGSYFNRWLFWWDDAVCYSISSISILPNKYGLSRASRRPRQIHV